jgi:AmmeMemoRadiSam system protein B
MLRLPAVSGRFYPSDPSELRSQINSLAKAPGHSLKTVSACLVPHAGYMYSGHVAGAVFGSIVLPDRIIVLGVRHSPRGQPAAILCDGAWRTPLGDAPIDSVLAEEIKSSCPLLKEDAVAHSGEHSLEVQLPFLQVLHPGFAFVPIALGTIHFESLVKIGEAIGRLLKKHNDPILLLTTSDLNHYEDDATTRRKDRLAINQLLAMDARGLYDVCASADISMCGLGPAVAMLTALRIVGATQAEVVRYATSADVSGDTSTVVGYVGMIFS